MSLTTSLSKVTISDQRSDARLLHTFDIIIHHNIPDETKQRAKSVLGHIFAELMYDIETNRGVEPSKDAVIVVHIWDYDKNTNYSKGIIHLYDPTFSPGRLAFQYFTLMDMAVQHRTFIDKDGNENKIISASYSKVHLKQSLNRLADELENINTKLSSLLRWHADADSLSQMMKKMSALAADKDADPDDLTHMLDKTLTALAAKDAKQDTLDN